MTPWLLLHVLGCAAEPSDACRPYHGAAHEQCHVSNAASAPSVAEAGCAEAGLHAEDCREAWVVGHRDRSLAELLAACTTDECRFLTIDMRAAPFPETFAACMGLRGFASECVGHATVRFLAGAPPVQVQVATFRDVGRMGEVVAHQVAAYAACGGVTSCSVVPGFSATCEDARLHPATQDLCPTFRSDFPMPP